MKKAFLWFGIVVGMLTLSGASRLVYAEEETEVSEAVEDLTDTVITSQRLTFDYKRSIAVFDGNVVVVDPNVVIESDRLTVLLDQTNDVKSATATGNVRLRQEDKKARSEKAIYLARSGEIILIGDASVTRGGDIVKGDKITFWVNEDRMECEPGQLILVPKSRSEASGKKAVPRRGTSSSR